MSPSCAEDETSGRFCAQLGHNATMNFPITDSIAGTIGLAILVVGYAGFKAQWPGPYRNLSDTFDLPTSAYVWRIAAFRIIPVFLAGLLIWSVSVEFGGVGWLAVTIAVVGHVLLSNGVALLRGLTRKSSMNQAFHHIAAGIFALLGGLAAVLTAPPLDDYIPTLSQLAEALWTALLVAVLGAFVFKATQGAETNRVITPEYLYARAFRDAGPEVFDEIYRVSIQNRTDPLLTTAVAVSEILQRPRWFRRCERLLGRFRKNGTYGVMQVSASGPLTDSESIRIFCETYADRACLRYDPVGYATLDENRLWEIAGEHNGGDKAFIDSVTVIYQWLLHHTQWQPDEVPEKILGLLDKRRHSTRWGLRFATTASKVTFTTTPSLETRIHERPTGTSRGNWWFIEHTCSISDDFGFVSLDENDPNVGLRLSISPHTPSLEPWAQEPK